MGETKLVHQSTLSLSGESYEIHVYARDDGHVFAETKFDDSDIIVSDGVDLHEVLHRHERLIPLAVDSRRVLQRTHPFPFRSKGYRTR